MDVSVVIVNWNTKEILSDCLSSIYRQTKKTEFETIVIDNGSQDGSAQMVKEKFPQVSLIKNRWNKGFASANNQGIARVRGRYVLLLNSDTVVLDHAIEKSLEFADNHPEAAVIGCRVLNADQTLQTTCFMYPSLLNMFLESVYLNKLFPNNPFCGREVMSWWHRDSVREVDVVTGCFMLVRSHAIEQVGNMDERFFMYGEETDWCYRFRKAGWKIFFTPDVEIVHIGGASSKQRKTEMILQLRGSILLFLKKHKNRFVYALACLLVAIFFLLRIPYWLTRAVISRNDRASHIQRALTYFRGVRNALMGGRALCVER